MPKTRTLANWLVKWFQGSHCTVPFLIWRSTYCLWSLQTFIKSSRYCLPLGNRMDLILESDNKIRFKSLEKILSVGSSNQNINLSIYNIICWVAWQWDRRIIDQASDVKSIIFFMISCKILCKNPFIFSFLFFYKNKELSALSLKNYKKNNTWNVRLLVKDLFVPSSSNPA